MKELLLYTHSAQIFPPNDPASAAARGRRDVRCKPMLGTRAQARFDDSWVSATVDASEDDDPVAGHAEPDRVFEAAKKNASVSAVEVRIREGIVDGSSDRFID